MRLGRARSAGLTCVVLLCTGGSAWFVAHQRVAVSAPPPAMPGLAQPARVPFAELVGVPHIVVRSTELGEDYGRVALLPLDDPTRARATTPQSCDRVYARRDETVCVVAEQLPLGASRAEVLDPSLAPTATVPLIGAPNRARLSRDGRYLATTTFRSGDSYATPGAFSTQTVVARVDGTVLMDLEQITLVHQGGSITAIDRNVWGVTFAPDGDTFYATAAWGGATWLVRGSVAGARMETIRGDAECPSLSPDGTRLVYKKLGERAGGDWRLTVLDLRTGVETTLPEQRSIDDQAEWLDDARVLYAVPRAGLSDSSVSDVFVVPADGSGAPTLLIPEASSPSVVR